MNDRTALLVDISISENMNDGDGDNGGGGNFINGADGSLDDNGNCGLW